MKRRRVWWLSVLFGVVSLLAFPTPASAHYDDYCGHGRHWHTGGYAEYVGSHDLWFTVHRHTVYVRKWPFTSYYSTVTCPGH